MFKELREPKISEPGSVEAMLTEVYGSDAVKDFENMRMEHPELSLEQALKRYEEEPTSQQSYFFRSDNIRIVAEQLAPKLEKKSGEPIEILDIGVSSGEEAYSLAVHMLDSGHKNFNIHGIDVSAARLSEAESGEYKFFLDSISELGNDSNKSQRLTREYVQKGYFQDSGKRWQQRMLSGGYSLRDLYDMKQRGQPMPRDAHEISDKIIIEPTKKLREHVSFGVHDIIDGPIKDKKYDIVVMNRVLMHYPEKTREQILRNVFESLKEGGFLVLESAIDINSVVFYDEWREHLTERFPLEVVATKRQTNDPKDTTYVSGEFYRYLGEKIEK